MWNNRQLLKEICHASIRWLFICADDRRGNNLLARHNYRSSCESTYLPFISDKLNVLLCYQQLSNLSKKLRKPTDLKSSQPSLHLGKENRKRAFPYRKLLWITQCCSRRLKSWFEFVFIYYFQRPREFILSKLKTSRLSSLSGDCGWTPKSLKLRYTQFNLKIPLSRL